MKLGEPMAGSIGNPVSPIERRARESKASPGKEAPAQDAVAKAAPSESPAPDTFEAFLETYRVGKDDIGYTAKEVYGRLQNAKEPDALDEEILEALLFQGFYERFYKIGEKSSFTLRTIGPNGLKAGFEVLAKNNPDGRVTRVEENTLLVARYLAAFGGKPTCPFRTQEEFESPEAVEARLKFVMDLPSALVDAIGERVNPFLNRTHGATTRSIENF